MRIISHHINNKIKCPILYTEVHSVCLFFKLIGLEDYTQVLQVYIIYSTINPVTWKYNNLNMIKVCLIVGLYIWGNIILPSEIQTEIIISQFDHKIERKKKTQKNKSKVFTLWLLALPISEGENIRRCNYLMGQWLLSWYAIGFLNCEVRYSTAEVDQNLLALLVLSPIFLLYLCREESVG